MLYRDVEKRKEVVRNFIKNNPKTTHKEIKKKLHLKAERVYVGGMAEAFEDAGVIPPRTFERKNKPQKKQIIIDYIKRNPFASGGIIKKDTKINISAVFKSIRDAYKSAEVPYPRETQAILQSRNNDERKKEVVDIIKKDPLMSIGEVMKRTNVHFYRIFKNTAEAYKLAGLVPLTRFEKRGIRKKKEIIEFIKKNPMATQREINDACKTHVQWHFENGIFDAYMEAGISFPYDRVKLHGIAIKEIKYRAKSFEDEVAIKLTGYGAVNRLVKTKRGFADIIFERNGKKTVVEVKDYLIHEISISQINQLNKYLEDCSCTMGFLICRKKPKKDRFLIGKNTILIITADELNRIPEVMDKDP